MRRYPEHGEEEGAEEEGEVGLLGDRGEEVEVVELPEDVLNTKY